MIDNSYNIFAKLAGEIEDFEQKGVYLVGKPSVRDQFDKENRGRDGGYYYSQKDTLEAVDLACASKFKRGMYDGEGKRKTFLNIVNFHSDVAINQTGVNTSNYIMEPTNKDFVWPVFLMDKKFKEWSDENSYDDIIDELNDDFCRKGSCVSKRIKGGVERVPLRTLRNTQTTKSLWSAASGGGYVIIENEMTYDQMKKYPKWKIDSLDKSKVHMVFDRYSLVPRAELMKFKGETPTDEDWNDMIVCMQSLIPHPTFMKDAKKDAMNPGVVAYIEEIDEEDFPLEEAHYKKIDGRWLGQGEAEKQLENQISRNFTANLRRRSLLWAAKKIFQSTDDEIARNLMVEVQDGAVLHIKKGGEVSQVNQQTQHLGDYAADEANVKENSQQISFSFESASGESMASGTPFRLGAILENAVSKYFKRKQDTFSNYLKRSFFDQLVPIFKKQMRDPHTIIYSISHDNYDQLKAAMVIVHANAMVKREWLKRNFISYDTAAQRVEGEMIKSPYLFADVVQDAYNEIHCVMRLNINEPIAADIESLTTVWQSLQAKGDPRADNVLQAILSKKGNNLDAIVGSIPKQSQGAAPIASPAKPALPAGGAPEQPVIA